MKRSSFGKLLKLTKNYLEDQKTWGEFEVMIQKRNAKPGESGATATQTLTLEEFHRQISKCKKCPLGKTRLNIVPGDGNPKARLMFIGEGPGYDEDHHGLPFVGRAGQLLTKIIESIGVRRKDVFIANVVKCHPMIDPSDPEKRGNDRPPAPEEIAECKPYLDTQIRIIKPDFICVLGSVAAKALLEVETGISRLRGKFYEYNGVQVMPTYHPAALLRNASLKKDVWEDMKKLRDAIRI